MGSTYLSLHYHIVFGTKGRVPSIHKKWRGEFHRYIGGTVKGLNGIGRCVGGASDHVHLLVSLSATHNIADFMRELKKATSVWAAETYDPEFAWQEGYAAFSVSASLQEKVRHYIDSQEEHHTRVSFMEELKLLLKKHEIDYNPKYLA
ncbi:MAG TPA: IS200/IS605 family transposase [Chthoniobacteraceae bacterium]|jgi:REP element-mobilizing transposase RayT|nr:IS200/IS605 family transposase [Chthoniobacteraceae bacterium]